MPSSEVNHSFDYARNENSDTSRNRILQSPSLQSLKSFMTTKRSSTAAPALVISQPTLAEASREKMRNKIRQSPSMLSIHARGADLATKYEKEQLNELLSHTSRGEPEQEFQKVPDRFYKEFSTAHTPAAELLQTLKIHAQLASIDVFAQILDVHMLPSGNDSKNQYRCVFEMPDYGTRLNETTFESKYEPVTILMSLAEALARAEETVQFEHRNLHPGSIMISRDPGTGAIVRVTILNCELSRTHRPGSPILFTSLEHPAFYEPRTPVLALMRKVVKDPAEFTPVTNILWLTYLARYMYNIRPSSKLRAIYDALNPRWPLRRGMRSTRDALVRMRAKLH